MKIAYNPITELPLLSIPLDIDITFDLPGKVIYARGVRFLGTDTTYEVFKKHTDIDDTGGYSGLVPAPSYTKTIARFLREDGNWIALAGITPPDTELDIDSTNSVENRVITTKIQELILDINGKVGRNQVVTASEAGLAPKIGTSCETTINSLADEWVLASTKGGEPTWRKLPLYAFLETRLYVGEKDEPNNSATTNGNTYLKLFENTTLSNLYNIKGLGRTTVTTDSSGNITITTPDTISWDSITNKPETFTPSAHTHSTSHIINLAEYAKAETRNALSIADTLNQALGKLEYKADLGVTAYDWYKSVTEEDNDDIINKWHEIVDFIDSVAENTDITDEFVTRKTPQTITGQKTFSLSGEPLIIHRASDIGASYIRYKNNETLLGDIGIGGSGSTYPYDIYFNDKDLNAHKIWHSGNDGSDSGLDADMLDGEDSTNYLRCYSRASIGTSPNFDNPSFPMSFFERRTSSETTGETGTPPPIAYAPILSMKTPDNIVIMQIAGRGKDWYIRGNQGSNVTLSNVSWNQIALTTSNVATATKLQDYKNNSGEITLIKGTRTDGTHERRIYDNGWTLDITNGGISGQIASVNHNVASATKLQTARTIWGQSFDGTGNVSGNLSGVGRIIRTSADAVDSNENGNLIFKNLNSTKVNYWHVDTADSIPIFVVHNNRNVGIGTENPKRTFVISNGGMQGLEFSPTHEAGSLISYNRSTNSYLPFTIAASLVGINTNDPKYMLHVNGTLNATTIYQNGSPLSSILGNYLPLSGGTLTGNLTIGDANNTSWIPIHFNRGSKVGFVGMGAQMEMGVGGGYILVAENHLKYVNNNVSNTIYHSGNLTKLSQLTNDISMIQWAGNHTEKVSSTTASSKFEGTLHGNAGGFYLTGSYNDANTPTNYGNIINMMGQGGGQLYCGWEGSYTTGKIFYRSHRDNTASGGWTSWKQLAYVNDIPTVTNYYWADLKISSSSNAATSPTVALLKATTGVQIGSTADYGWYLSSSRICAGISIARGVNVGSLLISSAWADHTKVPNNGIYSKGNIQTAGGFVKSDSSNSYVLLGGGGHKTESSLSVSYASSAGSVAWANVTGKPSFFSGNYNDLTNKPTIPSVGNGTITINLAGSKKGSFTLNLSGNVTIDLTDSNTTYSFSNSNPTLAWGSKSTIGTVGGVALTVTMPGNPNTWRGITDSYSGTSTSVSLSQKGAKALYDALVNGYASSAGNADTVDSYHIAVQSSTGTNSNTIYFVI